MRYLSLFFIFFLLLLFIHFNDARKGPEEYWKNIMKDEPMPKALKEFFYQDPASKSKEVKRWKTHSNSNAINMDHFIKAFGTKPNLIIYHSHVDKQVVEERTAKDTRLNMKLIEPQKKQS